MDTLTGSKDYSSNNDTGMPPESEIIQSDNSPKSSDPKISQFLLGSFYELSPEQFNLVSNLNPTQVSDSEFLRAAQQFNNEDFVRAAFLAYFKYEPSYYDLNYWITEIKIFKGDRSYLLDKLRKSEQFFAKIYKSNKLSPSGLIAKLFRRNLEILDVINLCSNNNEHIFWGGWIDSPKQGDKPKKPGVTINGWVMGKKSQVVLIRLISKSNSTALAETPVNIPRPDVSHAYCLLSNSSNWGFNINLALNKMPVDPDFLVLEGVFEDGITAPVAIILARK